VSLIFKTPLFRKDEMRLELQNYTVVNANEDICMKFNNNKINSLQRNDIAQDYIIVYKVGQHLSQHNLRISNRLHIQQQQHIVQ
jgi:hypothetical protein